MKKVLSLAVFFLLLTGIALAQTSKGILVGTVRDSTGAVIPQAKITVVSKLTGETRNVSSDADGAYRVEALNPSVYSLHVEAAGFSVLDMKDLHVLPSVVTSYNAQLSVGRLIRWSMSRQHRMVSTWITASSQVPLAERN